MVDGEGEGGTLSVLAVRDRLSRDGIGDDGLIGERLMENGARAGGLLGMSIIVNTCGHGCRLELGIARLVLIRTDKVECTYTSSTSFPTMSSRDLSLSLPFVRPFFPWSDRPSSSTLPSPIPPPALDLLPGCARLPRLILSARPKIEAWTE